MEQVSVLIKILRLSELLHDHKETQRKTVEKETPPILQEIRGKQLSHSGRKLVTVLYGLGACNQRALAQAVGITPQAVSETVKKLESCGYLTKVSGLQKNENFISLTPQGEELAVALNEMIQRHARDVFSQFEEEELSQLGGLLDKLLNSMEGNPNPPS